MLRPERRVLLRQLLLMPNKWTAKWHHTMATIAVLGTLDSKGEEHGFVADAIRKRGHKALLIDTGTLEAATIKPDITREVVARAGNVDLQAIVSRRDRGEAVAAMSRGAPVLLARLAAEGKVDGGISLGGGGGTAISTAAMRAVPIGFPKLMVTTLASGNTAPYVGVKDVVFFPGIFDVARAEPNLARDSIAG